jgi:hypothetical protein
MSSKNWDRVPIDAQSIDAPLSRAAVFLVVTVANEPAALTRSARRWMGLTISSSRLGFATFRRGCHASLESVATSGIASTSTSGRRN